MDTPSFITLTNYKSIAEQRIVLLDVLNEVFMSGRGFFCALGLGNLANFTS